MEPTRKERLKVTGEKLLQTIKKLVHEGNVRRITIKDEEDRTIVEIPMTVGVVGGCTTPATAGPPPPSSGRRSP